MASDASPTASLYPRVSVWTTGESDVTDRMVDVEQEVKNGSNIRIYIDLTDGRITVG
jgi:hypothetical protein